MMEPRKEHTPCSILVSSFLHLSRYEDFCDQCVVDMKAVMTCRVPLTSGVFICVPKPHEILNHLHP